MSLVAHVKNKTMAKREKSSSSKLPLIIRGLGNRILKAAKAVGGQGKLCDLTGISESQLYRYITESAQPTVGKLVLISQSSGKSLEWLATGQGPIQKPTNHRAGPHQKSEYMEIPFYGGPDDEIFYNENSRMKRRTILFPAEWVPVKKNKEYRLVKHFGDSMEPTLKDGDFVLVEHPTAEPFSDGLYVFEIGTRYLVKRLQVIPSGVHILKNDNPNYSEYKSESSENVRGLTIMGKVVWVGKYF